MGTAGTFVLRLLKAEYKKEIMMGMIHRIEDYDEWLHPYISRKELPNGKKYYSVDRVPIELMIENKVKSKKWDVYGICKYCGKEFTQKWGNYCQRKRTKNKVICGKCALKDATSQAGWKKANSDAQKKVQGTPEARDNMSKILKEKHLNDPDLAKRISKGLLKVYKDNPELREKISIASKKSWDKKDFREKVTGKAYHHGYFCSEFGDIYFASSWELMFLLWCSNNKDVTHFCSCEDGIPYKKPCGKTARYFPDFEVTYENGDIYIIEIKGGLSDIDLVERKRQAAKQYYKEKFYSILYGRELKEMGIMITNKKIKPWIDKLVEKGVVRNYGFGKKNKEN